MWLLQRLFLLSMGSGVDDKELITGAPALPGALKIVVREALMILLFDGVGVDVD